MSDLAFQTNRLFLELDSSEEALLPSGRFSGSAVVGEGEVAGADERSGGCGWGFHLYRPLCHLHGPTEAVSLCEQADLYEHSAINFNSDRPFIEFPTLMDMMHKISDCTALSIKMNSKSDE